MVFQFHLITRSANNGIPPPIPDTVSAIIQKNLSDYVYHATRSYILGSVTYSISEMQFKLKEEPPLDERHPLLLEACKKEGLDALGSGPIVQPGDCKALYLLYNAANIGADPSILSPRGERLVCECLILAGDGYIQPQQFYSIAAQDLDERDLFSEASACLKDHGLKQMAFVAYFTAPNWYETNSDEAILTPGANLETIFELCIQSTRDALSPNHLGELAMSNITIELYEVRCCFKRSVDETMKDEFAKESRKMTLLKTECWQVIKAEGDSFVIPTALYKCKLPQVGPTFFSSIMDRCYCLNLTVTVECKGQHCSRTFSSSLDICVAEDRRRQPCHLLLRPDSRREGTFLQNESLPHDSLKCSDVSSELYSHVQGLGVDCFQMHDTRCYSRAEKLFVTTWYLLKVSCGEGDLAEDFPCPALARAISSRESVSRCEVRENSKRPNTSIGYFALQIDGREFSDLVPYSACSVTSDVCIQDSTGKKVESEGSLMGLVSLRLTFQQPSLFDQEYGYNIVLPGMRLRDFIVLQMTLPSRKQVLSASKFFLRYVLIEFEELRTKTHNLSRVSWVHRHVLSSRKLNYPLDQSVETVPITLGHKVPDLAPVFYAHEFSRSYQLRIALKVGYEDQSEWLEVKLPINIAIDLAGLRESKIDPPSSRSTSLTSVRKQSWWEKLCSYIKEDE